MISLAEVLKIHEILIEEFGGAKGIRGQGLLEASIYRPFATFENQELYPEIEDKAAAILESVVKNHPFPDGNKRIGYTLMRLLPLNAQKDLDASEDEKHYFVIRIAESKMTFEEIQAWIKEKVVKERSIGDK
jgi:death-on-curing protein